MSRQASDKSNRAVKDVAVMMAATVIAKLLGMLRGVLIANAYGTTWQANAFTAATRIPLSAFDLFLSAAILGCFIPVYNSFKESANEQDTEEADRFASVFLNFIVLACGLLAVLGIVFAKPLVGLITNGLDTPTVALAVTLTRIMFPLVIFAGAAYTLVGVLQSKGSFIAPALISAMSNLGVIVYLVFFDWKLADRGIYGLAAAYLASWVLQLLVLIIPLSRKGFKYRLLFDLKNPQLKRAIKMVPPIVVGSWLAPTGALIGQYFAANIASHGVLEGATTVFDCAMSLYIIIAGTLTYSICNYTFPKISRLSADGDDGELFETVRNGLISALFIVIPFMAAATVLSGEGVAIVYMRGEFTSDDAYSTACALTFMLPAIPFFALGEMLSRVFFAKNQPSVPMYAALVGIIINLVATSAFLIIGVYDIAAVGFAYALGQISFALTLIAFAVIRFKGLFNKDFEVKIIKILLGAVAVFLICALLSHVLECEPYTTSFITNLWKSGTIFLVSAFVYILYAKLARINPTKGG